mmetsp:Transcript_36803/g.54063  ORF Transcript_36803/g.54063 Transcript_36803/m.54063 type:complete len:229 (-) Transcript_36803:205-891(-)
MSSSMSVHPMKANRNSANVMLPSESQSNSLKRSMYKELRSLPVEKFLVLFFAKSLRPILLKTEMTSSSVMVPPASSSNNKNMSAPAANACLMPSWSEWVMTFKATEPSFCTGITWNKYASDSEMMKDLMSRPFSVWTSALSKMLRTCVSSMSAPSTLRAPANSTSSITPSPLESNCSKAFCSFKNLSPMLGNLRMMRINDFSRSGDFRRSTRYFAIRGSIWSFAAVRL